MLAARIDRLPPATKDLQCAAVIGRTVPFTLLETVAGIAPAELRHGLGPTPGGGIPLRDEPVPDLEYTSSMPLTLEVAYQTLLRERRRLLHARAHGARKQRVGEDAIEDGRDAGAPRRARARRGPRPRAICTARRCQGAGGGGMRRRCTFTSKPSRPCGTWRTRLTGVSSWTPIWSCGRPRSRTVSLRVTAPGSGSRSAPSARALDDGLRLARGPGTPGAGDRVRGRHPGYYDVALDLAREAAGRADPQTSELSSYARFIAAIACRDIGRMEEAIQEFDRGVEVLCQRCRHAPATGLRLPDLREPLRVAGRKPSPPSDGSMRRSDRRPMASGWPRKFGMWAAPRSRAPSLVTSTSCGENCSPPSLSSSAAWPSRKSKSWYTASAPTACISAGPCCWQGTPRVGSSASNTPSSGRRGHVPVDALLGP